MRYRAVVIGASTGGMEALRIVLSALPEKFAAPILIVQHISPHSDNYMATYLNNSCRIEVKEAVEKEVVAEGNAYIAPPNYHLLIEKDRSLSLTVDSRVNYARPSIDVLFETAADAYGKDLIGIVLTGANNDGSKGLKKIKEYGGVTIVQDPATAEAGLMPKAAIETAEVDYILTLKDIGKLLNKIVGETNVQK